MILADTISIPAEDFSTAQDCIIKYAAKKLGISRAEIKTALLLKKSLDARKRPPRYIVSVAAELVSGDNSVKGFKTYAPPAMPLIEKLPNPPENPPVIVGFGPAGIFAALVLARAGANPIVLEQGCDVDSRRAIVRDFWAHGKLDVNSNAQFGEGGAGTFSDGKLTTGIKSPYISFILAELVKHGAPAEILYEAKPHIGTDLLSQTVKNIRNEIISLGGTVIFGAQMTDFALGNGSANTVIYRKNNTDHEIETNNLVLAIGHSARGVFELLHKKNLALSPKPFSVGLRIEHLQSEINYAMYGDIKLPPADYKLAVKAADGRGVYTFCMCPGGYVVACSSESETVVTNGMSCFARDGVNANSALLVNVYPSDFPSAHPLAGIEFQRAAERAAYISGGSNYSAPSIMTGDFLGLKIPSNAKKVTPTYKPSVTYAPPDEYLPSFVCKALRETIPLFGRKIKGFDSPASVLTGPETRSSSPVRIERDENRQAIGFGGIYPCGEGAGYAGGIMSAAADGIETAMHILGLRPLFGALPQTPPKGPAPLESQF